MNVERDRKKEGKKNKASGADFERRVRTDLEEKGWIVNKWSNNVDLGFRTDEPNVVTHKPRKIIQCKASWDPFRKCLRMVKGGNPDYVCHRLLKERSETFFTEDGQPRMATTVEEAKQGYKMYEVIGVEAKSRGNQDITKEDREMFNWYLKNKVFSKILIASKHKINNRIHIEYEDYNGMA